ncbi:MAG: hypothetical protein CNCCGFBP_01763 [Fimbriimonadaceae bacterium]|nr:hypothetical protein [Fimbriimonadaceae bacterium]
MRRGDSGGAKTAGSVGPRCLKTKVALESARSRFRAMERPCGSGQARPTANAPATRAPEFSSRPTRARPGKTLGSSIRTTSAGSNSTPETKAWPMSPRSATSTPITTCAGYSRPRTAERRGSRSSSWAPRRVRSMWRSTPAGPTPCMRRHGSASGARGTFGTWAAAQGSSEAPTQERRGRKSRTGFPKARSGESGSLPLLRRAESSTPSSTTSIPTRTSCLRMSTFDRAR